MLNKLLSDAKSRITSIRSAINQSANNLFGIFLSAPVWVGILLGAGVIMITLGVRILAGDGWAFIVSGAFCLFAALILLKGIARE